MRRSSLITLSLLGVGGSALAAGTFAGGRCDRAYPSLDQCIAAHGAANCTERNQNGPDGKLTTVALGPDRSCSAWHSGGIFFMPGYWGGYGYGGGYFAPGTGTSRSTTTLRGSLSPSQRGGFGATGSHFSSGS